MLLSDNTILQKNLFEWWSYNKRTFPWRKTKEPYHILISELLLHRTRADQVVPIYNKFIKKYPTVYDIHKGNIEEIKTILKPLGLFWRNELIFNITSVSGFWGSIFCSPASEEIISLGYLFFN